MLDVHAPHETTHTWKDFFIHIATIVLGLLIALSLEQSIELVHHRAQRRELIQDLRGEAEKRISRKEASMKFFAVNESWYRNCLRAARDAKPAGGYVTFVLPDRPQLKIPPQRPEDAVWASAKASGKVAVLSTEETEAWGRVDFLGSRSEAASEAYQAASTAARATADHIGSSLAPGASMHVTPEERDEFTRALGTLIETEQAFRRSATYWESASDAVLHGAYTLDAMQPYFDHASQTFPH